MLHDVPFLPARHQALIPPVLPNPLSGKRWEVVSRRDFALAW